MPNYYKVSDNGQLEIDWMKLEEEFCQEFVEAIRSYELSPINTEIVSIIRDEETDTKYRAILKHDFSVTVVDCQERRGRNEVKFCSFGKEELFQMADLFKGVK